MAISQDLLDLLACPQCKQPVQLSPDGAWLVCATCRLRYEIKDDIPIMLVDEARPLEP
ncbi:MAG: Trm112 family protein [Thermodesulfobacteriota bacterium]